MAEKNTTVSVLGTEKIAINYNLWVNGMSNLIEELTDKDDKKAYARTKEIAAASEFSPEYYSRLEVFASLLKNEKSYIRTRAFILCCSQARWDTEGKLKDLMPALMLLLHDPKPTVVRQCLNAVKEMVVFRPELRESIRKELERMDLSEYKESMSGLIQADITELRELIEETTPKIRALSQTELENSLELVWKVFLAFEAVNYPEEGKTAFYAAIHSQDYLRTLTAYGAFDQDEIIGIIATRNEGAHIALYFVDGEYQRRGIGRKLFEKCLEDNDKRIITVHSSEYALNVYKKLGFVQTEELREEGGIRYIPMVLER